MTHLQHPKYISTFQAESDAFQYSEKLSDTWARVLASKMHWMSNGDRRKRG